VINCLPECSDHHKVVKLQNIYKINTHSQDMDMDKILKDMEDEHGAISMETVQGDFGTEVFLNNDNETAFIWSGIELDLPGGLLLDYNSQRFMGDCTEFVGKQLEAHTIYEKLINGKLTEEYKGVQSSLDKGDIISRIFESLPLDANRETIERTKESVADIPRSEGVTLEENMTYFLEVEYSLFGAYYLMEKVVNYGKSLIEAKIAENDDRLKGPAQENLSEWLKIQTRLSDTYSKFVKKAKENFEASKVRYEQLFPEATIRLEKI